MTNDGGGGNISKLSDERFPKSREESVKHEKPNKKRNNLLTNREKRVILEKFQARARNAVPCKLNNVKTNYNTLDNYMDCLSVSEKQPTKILE